MLKLLALTFAAIATVSCTSSGAPLAGTDDLVTPIPATIPRPELEPPLEDSFRCYEQNDNLDFEYLGMTEADARRLADERGIVFEVTASEGEPCRPVTADLNMNRIRVTIMDGVISSGSVG